MAVTTAPQINSATCQSKPCVLNKNPAATAPAFPPAPTMPLTDPSARRLMNGTTAYVAPLDIFTNNANVTISGIASESTVA